MELSSRRAAIVAGVGLLLMAVLAAFANFGVLEDPHPGDGAFRLGVAALMAVAILDIVAAWALWVFYAPTDAALSTLAAWLRIAYTAVFLVAIARLSMSEVDSFREIWSISLTLFGAHLVALGYLVAKAKPVWLGVVLALAGASYLVDGFAKVAGYDLKLATVGGFGEVALIGWLLIRGARRAVSS
ncbi:DUF4386 domain-containing protein [Actinokineospora sp. HUAS TT18]|uniref:DUF4386 domain-containing protein n=1 Tax=Actinokineospora sp. HUAS TT18 TaxID=3447451 RepID=UPI003F51C1D7